MKILVYRKDTGEARYVVSGKDNIKRTIETLADDMAYKETTLSSPSGWVVNDGVETRAEQVADPRKQKKLRRMAFQAEADPLFFKWQRGEATEEDYRAAVDAVRKRFPYQE